jgi:hypothetical protein
MTFALAMISTRVPPRPAREMPPAQVGDLGDAADADEANREEVSLEHSPI